MTMTFHTIEPFIDHNSKILILGSFPSVKSRETGFYYGHPQNRFWKVISQLYGELEPISIDRKKEMLARHGIALWDVIASCDITGSSDASITNITVNPVEKIIPSTQIDRIFTNGRTAHKYYDRYLENKTGLAAVCLPSTSPANASYSIDRLLKEWCVLLY